MLSRRVLNCCCRRSFRTSSVRWAKGENPIRRTARILTQDVMNIAKVFKNEPTYVDSIFPKHVDIAIIGGGAMGSSIAYWLKEKTGLNGIKVAVIERDKTYAKASTVLSMGGLRQQFSLPENIHMSMFGAEFMRTLKKRFGEDADVFFTPNGYLMLASENGAQQMLDSAKLQKELGAINKVMGKEELKRRFPWLSVDDVELGCLGLEKEGWFDPWALLCLLKRGAINMNTQYIDGEVVDFTFVERFDFIAEGSQEGTYQGLDELIVKSPNGELNSMKFAYCVIAAGCDSGELAKKARVGAGHGILSIPLPVERRKRYVYCFECQENGPSINTPLTIDCTGTYFRREGLGGTYLCGLSPSPEEEPTTADLDVDYKYFDERVWPNLAHRVKAFNSLKVRNAWGGYYDYNGFDENGIIGMHPYYHNLVLATGFSGHGIQQAPAVGRAVAELILDGAFQTIDLTRFGFDRLVVDQPMYEAGIV